MIEIAPGVAIGDDEIRFSASRSGGPGGQHVNKVATRVALRFDLEGSPSLTPEQKARIRKRLGARVASDGTVRVVSRRHRSQHANRVAALGRLIELLREALRPEIPRRPTAVPAPERERRLEAKRKRALRKRERSGGGEEG